MGSRKREQEVLREAWRRLKSGDEPLSEDHRAALKDYQKGRQDEKSRVTIPRDVLSSLQNHAESRGVRVNAELERLIDQYVRGDLVSRQKLERTEHLHREELEDQMRLNQDQETRLKAALRSVDTAMAAQDALAQRLEQAHQILDILGAPEDVEVEFTFLDPRDTHKATHENDGGGVNA